MKKTLLFIVLCLLIGATAGAKTKGRTKGKAKANTTYMVEKAFQVCSNGKALSEGATLSPNSRIEIKDCGFLMFVDQKAMKRYYVSKSQKGKVKDIVKDIKEPKSVSRAYLESIMGDNYRRYRKTNGAKGSVEGRPGTIIIDIDDKEFDENGEIKVYILE